MDLHDLLLIIKNFLLWVDDEKIYSNLAKILDITSDITYIERKIERPFSSQPTKEKPCSTTEFYFEFKKPIPFSLIEKMEEEITFRKQQEKNLCDKQYSSGVLAELVDEL